MYVLIENIPTVKDPIVHADIRVMRGNGLSVLCKAIIRWIM